MTTKQTMAKKYTPTQIDAFFESGGDLRALTKNFENKAKHTTRKEPAPRGKAHTWVVPPDIEEVFKKYGTAWLWDAIRFKINHDAQQKNTDENDTENKNIQR